ncbi:MAG: 30S ribosomal protein S1 [Planctomycetota bacterium]|nr:30S ribosomal protein S1 [Planctomycetota bacterium]MDA1252465.1 30S ribosomal protein S1 [Planctomycetota bacterium]
MVDRNLLREFNISDDELDAQFKVALGDDYAAAHEDDEDGEYGALYSDIAAFDPGTIVPGRVIRIEGDDVLIDVGYKSEGVVSLDEWSDVLVKPVAGDEVDVLLENFEDQYGLLLLSKRKADRIREWNKIIATHGENDIVTGKVVRKIKGGLLVNIGVNVFLPASQVDIRRPHDIGVFIDKEIECVILKIDEARRNIVVSRRKLIEDKRTIAKEALLADLIEGDTRKGVVKNIADFGAFVDLGGIDGLLHITDMSWGRISHPSDMVKIEDQIEVKILNIDREREKIALGLKQLTPSPWDGVEAKYPVGDKVKGEVVNVMTYGAFVKLEDGIEGLVHISEMSWTKRVNHPTELVQIGDEVDVVVLGINKDKQEISLGMKQTQANPWDNVTEKYPVDTTITGTVRNLTNYGAFIEMEEGVDGLLHVSDMSWTRKISHASEMLKKGMELECRVISVDEDRKRIALGLKQLSDDPWETTIPEKYRVNSIVKGVVTKITNFGVFVELESELEGLLHVSELSDQKVENPETLVSVGDELEVRVLRVDIDDRKIGLSRKLDVTEEVPAASGGESSAAAPGIREPLKGGIGGGGGGLMIEIPSQAAEEEAAVEEPVATEVAVEADAATEEAVAEEAAVEVPVEEEAATEEPAAEEAAEEPAAEADSDDAEEPAAEESEEKE